ncbi:MAG: HNH endonuclease [Limisphaerales bacterium]
MDASTRQLVRERAGHRCEYCRMSERHSALRFHVEHILPRQHGGADATDNLALACPACNLRKGPNLTGIDPDTGAVTRLFHPRTDQWEEHFVRDGATISGRSPVGRTTTWLLDFNSPDRLRWRQMVADSGPPD